ncbi:MAG: glycosyltransferase [Chlorobi bacterium]|nr:glycosyltransferase [Chlorobiota bacterium]
MKLSVVIVNYNVKYFLAQCLLSVEKARKEYQQKYGQNLIEIFVVDNNSKDRSCEFVKKEFSDVILIENNQNVGFSAANNQAIKQSNGEYVLLLNPDTIIPENSFIKILDFADKHTNAGGIGVKMTDGNGVFLPESKRAFPSPAVSFYKMFGLSKLFPKSKRFGKYHLTYLNKNEIHKVDVLSGAFMLLRKTVLDKIGLLDETFFMYGEDIDLSYRIVQNGFSNYYFPEVSIIHYKGESTKKGSLNYVFVFFNAMIIFAKKHFSGKNAFFFSFLIKAAIIFRAGLSVFKRIFYTLFIPLSDALIFYAGFYLIKPLWENIKFQNTVHYPKEYMMYAVPSYITVWIFAILLSKGYQRPFDSKRLFKGILSGTFIILIIYSLLNENYRYSRLLLITGTAWAMFFSWLIRAIFTILKSKYFSFQKTKKEKYLVIADENGSKKTDKVLKQFSETDFSVLNIPEYNFDKIKSMVKNEMISDVILSVNKMTYSEIISFIQNINFINQSKAIAYPGKGFIIECHSLLVSGEIYTLEDFNLNKTDIKIQKRLFDITFSILLVLLSPVLILLIENKKNVFGNILSVLRGKKTWVGYIESKKNELLPNIKPGILNPVSYSVSDSEEIMKINQRYARYFHLTDDFYIVYKSFSGIGNKKL